MTSVGSVRSINWDGVPEATVHGTIRRRVFETDKVTVVRYDFAPGSIFPMHRHPESQVTVVLAGALTFDYGDRAEQHRVGDVVAIPGGVAHEGRAGDEPTVALCIFAPPRRDIAPAVSKS